MKTAINYFSRVLVALVLCAGLMVTGCAKINDALEGHGNRLDNLEGVQIKNLICYYRYLNRYVSILS